MTSRFLTPNERQLLTWYRAADERGQGVLLNYARFVAEEIPQLLNPPPPPEPPRVLPFRRGQP